MDTDLVLTIGIVLAVMSVPSLLAAWAESRAPRIGLVLAVAAIGMIVTALMTRPGGYSLSEVPTVMLGVVSRGLN
jgi:formate-dependent nitrite reductase membrane component NrfD